MLTLDHVQIAAPAGCEADARAFYGELLELREIAKPAALAARGGVWFAADSGELHVGIEEAFIAAKKAHPAFRLSGENLDAVAERLTARHIAVDWDNAILGVRRFYTKDPWGNRLELLSRA